MADQKSDPSVTQFGSLVLDQPAELPDVLDILIAGGGPSGTAAAMRARELGLSVLVVEHDDLMKRIRDYPKEKLILPSYGGSDKIPFPPGGKFVEALQFNDIDKDDLVTGWKSRYREASVPAKIGSEFTGLERRDDETWDVITWSHRAASEVRYVARAVLIAVGAGVPRRFDIPGDTDGIALRLDDAANYLSGPVVVIGGGTSACEAVIAISNTKTAGEDPSCVYWSYRADRMPKVSRALGEVFFEAYVGNGNIRYIPFSDPVAVVLGADRREYLSIRVERKLIEGRPPETVHLEFSKDRVIACIGEDLPFALLRRLNIEIPLVNDVPRVLVSHNGECSLPGVFLIGDARGPRYLRCTDFADSSTFEKINEKRNIKAAMHDAVTAVNAIAERAGIAVERAPAERTREEAPRPTPVKRATGTHAGEPDTESIRYALVSLHPDGTPEEEFPITKDAVRIGRRDVEIACPEDPYMADHHVTVNCTDRGCSLTDTEMSSGVWVRVQDRDGQRLQKGDQIWLGGQALLVDQTDNGWELAHHDREGVFQASHPVGAGGVFVGRKSQLVLDPTDTTLSRRHAQFLVDSEGLKIYDRGARNGSWILTRGVVPLENGVEFRIATKTFRFERAGRVEKISNETVIIPLPVAEPVQQAAATPIEKHTLEGPVVAFDHDEFPVTFAVPPGHTVLKAFVDGGGARDEPLGWECQKGVCGLCAVEILDGADNFEAVDPGSSEMKTIQIAVGVEPDPSRYRLACISRLKGPVKLRLPE